MSQDSKEWIKTRMSILKKQAGFTFNQDLFISILLCLISGRDKHLILTAPPNRLNEVTQMAVQISKSLFGLSTAKMVCSEHQTRTDLIDSLFNTREDLDNYNLSVKNKPYDTAIHSHKVSRSMQTLDSKASDKSQASNQTGSRNTSVKLSLLADEDYLNPISPVDFNLRKRDRTPFILSRTNTSTNSILQKELKNKSRWSEYEDNSKRSVISTNKLAQSLIIQNLDLANESIQALLLELIVTKELRMSNIRYSLPKPFLVIAVLPQGYDRLSISSQLMDRFFISYNFEEEMFLHISSSIRQANNRRYALMKQDEIKGLAEKASKVHINIDITRYIRDIVVGIRTHPRVKSGLTARCSQDLVTVTKSLATLFERDYMTPDLVTIAAEKVFSHRLHVLAINTNDDQMEKEDMSPSLPSDIVAEIIRIVYVPV